MPTTIPVPTSDALIQMLSGLVSAPVDVTRTTVDDPERDARGIFAEYVTDADELSALAFADHRAVNFIGGALVGVDAETLLEASNKAVFAEAADEGFQEVVNILASCLNSEFTKHVRLAKVLELPGQLDDDVKELWRRPGGRQAFRIAVEDHGTGTLILYFR